MWAPFFPHTRKKYVTYIWGVASSQHLVNAHLRASKTILEKKKKTFWVPVRALEISSLPAPGGNIWEATQERIFSMWGCGCRKTTHDSLFMFFCYFHTYPWQHDTKKPRDNSTWPFLSIMSLNHVDHKKLRSGCLRVFFPRGWSYIYTAGIAVSCFCLFPSKSKKKNHNFAARPFLLGLADDLAIHIYTNSTD